ncbi:dynein light chain [Echinococcus multilocularis]|uniref:Dynein light chain n=1 Tax=Echinococcus multilocularis TaxID=6211 RepID=A0A068YHG7_ECHMU|nr:dynein light chain [Echinococcus multilocularis]
MAAYNKAVIKSVDLSDVMQQDAVDVAKEAVSRNVIERDIATYIKAEFDLKYSHTWHCVAGQNHGNYFTYEARHFIHFMLGHLSLLLFKAG